MDHIRSTVTKIATSDNKVVVTRANNNLSTNNYIVVNIGIKRVITDFVYNKELDSVAIWSISRTYYRIDKANCCTNISKFWITISETTKHLVFLAHSLSKFLGHNLEYMWGVNGAIEHRSQRLVTQTSTWFIHWNY